MTDEAVAEEIRVPLRINPTATVAAIDIPLIIKQEITPVQAKYYAARESLLGADMWKPHSTVDKANLIQLVDSGLNEVVETMENLGHRGQYETRNGISLIQIKTQFERAKDVLSGNRARPDSLVWVVNHSGEEQLEVARTESKRLLNMYQWGISLDRQGGKVVLHKYRSGQQVQTQKRSDIQYARELPVNTQVKIDEVLAYVSENFPSVDK